MRHGGQVFGTFRLQESPGQPLTTVEERLFTGLAAQGKHANAVHGTDAAEEDHPLPREWVAAVMQEAARNGGKFEWVNCGLCIDERGANDVIAGVKRGSPADFWKMAGASDNVLVIPTR